MKTALQSLGVYLAAACVPAQDDGQRLHRLGGGGGQTEGSEHAPRHQQGASLLLPAAACCCLLLMRYAAPNSTAPQCGTAARIARERPQCGVMLSERRRVAPSARPHLQIRPKSTFRHFFWMRTCFPETDDRNAVATAVKRGAASGSAQVWRLAMPKNCVVAVELTGELLARLLGEHGIPYAGVPLFREETWSKACVAQPWLASSPLLRMAALSTCFAPQRSIWVSAGYACSRLAACRLCFLRVWRPATRGMSWNARTRGRRVTFQEGDWVVSDVAPSTESVPFAAAGEQQPTRQNWVWKQLNKLHRGQTLITRTIDGDTFRQTYRPVELRADGSLPPSSLVL